MKNVVMVAVTLAAVMSAGRAEAGLMSLSAASGTAIEKFQTPPPPGTVAANDVIPGLWGYLNGSLSFTGVAGQQYQVTFKLIGSESGWTNQLRETVGNTTLVEQADLGKSISYIATATGSAQVLQFQFETLNSTQPVLVNGTTAGSGQIVNGGTSAGRTFYVSFCADPGVAANQQQTLACNTAGNATTGDIAWLALDDSGAGPNDNHDDWVGLVSVKAVPDGGTAASLLGVSLLGLGVLRRKFTV